MRVRSATGPGGRCHHQAAMLMRTRPRDPHPVRPRPVLSGRCVRLAAPVQAVPVPMEPRPAAPGRDPVCPHHHPHPIPEAMERRAMAVACPRAATRPDRPETGHRGARPVRPEHRRCPHPLAQAGFPNHPHPHRRTRFRAHRTRRRVQVGDRACPYPPRLAPDRRRVPDNPQDMDRPPGTGRGFQGSGTGRTPLPGMQPTICRSSCATASPEASEAPKTP